MKNKLPRLASRLRFRNAFAYWSIYILFVCCSLPTGLSAQVDSAKFFAAKAQEKIAIGQIDSARYYSNLSFTLLKNLDSLADWLQTHQDLGRALIKKGQVDEAMNYFQSGLNGTWEVTPRNTREWDIWGTLHLSMGYIYSKRGDVRKARDFYEIGRTIRQKNYGLRDSILGNVILRPLGNIYARLRDYDKSYRYLLQAKKICSEIGYQDGAAIAANGIGWMYFTQNEINKSILSFQEGLAMQGLSLNIHVQLLINLGRARLENNEVDEALNLTTQAQHLLDQSPNSFTSNELWADIHDNLGNIYQHQKLWEDATSHFRSFISFLTKKNGTPYHRETAQGWLELCDLFAESGHPDSTLHYAQLALHCLLPKTDLKGDFINPPRDSLYSEHTLSLAFEQKITALNALSIRNPKDTMLLIRCLETCDLLFTTDEILRREYDFEESKLFRQDASHPYFEIALSAAYRLSAISHNAALTEQAWQYAELARVRLLIESMEARDREVAAYIPEETQRKLASLRKSRTNLMTLLNDKKNQDKLDAPATDSLESLLFEKHLAWQSLVDSIEKPEIKGVPPLPRTDLSALRGMLTNDQAILEYFCGDSVNYVFVLTKQELRFFKCPSLLDLKVIVQEFRNSLTDKDLRSSDEKGIQQFSQSASNLYDALLSKPLAALPPSIKRLVIVQDGLLNEVPFEILGKANGPANFKTFPYLLHKYVVSYANSGSLLLKQSEEAHRPDPKGLQPFIGFAPQYGKSDTLGSSPTRKIKILRGEYQDLPESRKEVDTIATMLQGKRYLGPDATEKQFKQQAQHGRILHLAMHAWLDGNDPMFSKLIFTQNPMDISEDNELNAIELYDMHLNAKMAVLSACKTGLGKARQGEGVMSLARAFAYAGVPATLMSLWEVEDGVTHLIMIDFYTYLKIGLRKDEALQRAKLNYLINCEPEISNPYYWAGFIASGNMEALFGQ